jgi:putative DNA primase/helicase
VRTRRRRIGTAPPVYLPPEEHLDNFPADLAALPAARFWTYQEQNGKWTKAPCTLTGTATAAREYMQPLRQAWEQAHAKGGLGVAIDPPEGYVWIDFDACYGETGFNGKLNTAVETWIRRFDSYTEYSPSFRGLHVWIKGEKPNRRTKRAGDPFTVEVYGPYGNGATVTCAPLHPDDTNDGWVPLPRIENRQDVLDAFFAEVFPEGDAIITPGEGVTLEDDQILKLILASAQSDKFQRLFFMGDTSDYADDHSAADLGLCCILAWWLNNDPERIDEWFRESKLVRDKWTKREDYRALTINKAIKHTPQPFGSRQENVPTTQADVDAFMSYIGGSK